MKDQDDELALACRAGTAPEVFEALGMPRAPESLAAWSEALARLAGRFEKLHRRYVDTQQEDYAVKIFKEAASNPDPNRLDDLTAGELRNVCKILGIWVSPRETPEFLRGALEAQATNEYFSEEELLEAISVVTVA